MGQTERAAESNRSAKWPPGQQADDVYGMVEAMKISFKAPAQ